MNIDFKKDYVNWLYNNISQYQISENVYRITLPFLDRNNDCTEIFIKVDGDTYTLTDDGETIGELELSNFDIFSSQKRTDIFNRILCAHGVKKSPNNELYIQCFANELPQKKHMLSQCMIKVSDLFYTAKNTVQTLFIEDVQEYLEENDIRYSQDISFLGISGLNTSYDFVIPKSKKAPERIIKVVNNIDQTQANSILFLWGDTSKARESIHSKLYVFLQDQNRKIPSTIIPTMTKYDVTPVLWSKRQDFTAELIA